MEKKRLKITAFRFIIMLFMIYAPFLCPDVQGKENDKKENRKDKINTPAYYETHVRDLFNEENWEEGFQLLEKGLKLFPNVSGLNELAGKYYYHLKDYDAARYYLILSVRDNYENVRAKQMLVNVEDETENYSSAICYVNELLEVNPYSRGLWRRKIELYARQGNNIESDRLLRRLLQIYPNDSILKNDLNYNLETDYIDKKRAGKKEEAIKSLKELILLSDSKEEYYMDLANLLLQQGDPNDAIMILSSGLSYLPGNISLIMKKAETMAFLNQYPESLSLLKENMKYDHTGKLRPLYYSIELEAAEYYRSLEAYNIYSKIYSSTRNAEALDYLISTSITRGYNEEALEYISDAIKRYGRKPSLLYKEYIVNKRLGNTGKANGLLIELYIADPANTDVATELSLLRLNQASVLMNEEFYAEALPYLKFAADNGVETDIAESAWNKIFTCYFHLRQYDKALSSLDSLKKIMPDYPMYIQQKAAVYNSDGQTVKALSLLQKAIEYEESSEVRISYILAYEDIAIPFIKQLIESGSLNTAFDNSVKLLNINPSSPEGLIYAINTSGMLNKTDEYRYYIFAACRYYPYDTQFLVKYAGLYQRDKEYSEALHLLRPQLDSLPANTMLVGAFSENSELYAYELLKEKERIQSMSVIDSALIYDAHNPSLLYAKGQIYEAMKRYDSAYYYQREYVPALLEKREFVRHISGLISRTFKNEISLEYLRGDFLQESNNEEGAVTTVATASYMRKGLKNNYIGRINYSGRNGSAFHNSSEAEPGGIGIQLQGEWEHIFNDKWMTMLNAAWGSRYFPSVVLNGKLEYNFKNDWSGNIRLGYRRVRLYNRLFTWNEDVYDEANDRKGMWLADGWKRYDKDLFNVGIGASKIIDSFILSGKTDVFLLSSKVYVNGLLQGKYYPWSDGCSYITALAGIGTAPEATVIDNAMPNSFEKITANVGLGGMYMVTPNLLLGLTGTWYTFYNQNNFRSGNSETVYRDYTETKYKNLYNIHAQVYIRF